MNQMWGGEPSELVVAEGYWIAFGAKPLYVVDDTFCLIPTHDANFCYLDRLTFGASAAQNKPEKKGSDGDVTAASLMIKSTKGWRRERRELAQLRLRTFPSWEVFILYLNFSLIIR